MIFNDVKKSDVFSIFFLSIVLYTPFSNLIFDVSGVYFLELAIIVSIFATRFFDDRNLSVIVYILADKIFLYFVTVVFFAGLIGYAVHGDFTAAYADFRANCVLLLGVLLGIEIARDTGLLKYWLAAAIFTGIVNIAHWVVAKKYALPGYEVKYPSVLFSVVFSSVILCEKNARFSWLFSIALLGFLSAVSFYRQYLLIAISVVVYGLLRRYKVGSSRDLIFDILLVAGVITAALTTDSVIAYYNDDDSRYGQLIGKTDDIFKLFEGTSDVSESDGIRMAYFEFMFYDAFGLIFPHGLGARAFVGDLGDYFYGFEIDPNTLDALFLYIVFHYGWFLSLLVFIFIGGRVLRMKAATLFERVLLLLPFLIVGLFDGSQFTIAQKGFWFGIYFGYVLYAYEDNKPQG